MQGDNSKWTYIASLVVVDGSIDKTVQALIFDYNIGDLQAGEIKGFAGRDHSDAVAVTQCSHRRVTMWRKDYFAVYLVAYQGHVVLAA